MVCVLISEQTTPCFSPKSSAIVLGNHRVCCDFGRISLLLSLSERKKTQVVFGAQTSITLCVTSVNKRGTFKYVSSDSNRSSDYYLTGKLRRLYGEQELSSSARAGSYFGLIGALATSGATTNGTIAIEFTDLVVHRKSDGAKIKLEDVQDRFAGELHADAYCWCIYDNVNDQLKLSVDKMAAKIEKSISTLESTK